MPSEIVFERRSAAVVRTTAQDVSRHTVSDLFERYLTHLERRRRAPSTIRCYRSAYARAKPRLGAIPADRIDLADLCELHEDWHETPVLADRTISYISAALTHAERLGWRPIGSNPCKLIERYAPKPELVPVDRETLVKILDAVDDLVAAEEIDLVSATCFRLLVFTGARLKEILTAKWSFLDLEEAVLHLPKAKRGARDVALPDEALAVLAHLPRLGPYICPGRDPRKPRVEVRRAWAKVVRRVGCRGLRRHDLRHGFATALHEANVPLAQIGELLGHRDPRTTNRYAHPRVGRLRGEISAVLRRRSA